MARSTINQAHMPAERDSEALYGEIAPLVTNWLDLPEETRRALGPATFVQQHGKERSFAERQELVQIIRMMELLSRAARGGDSWRKEGRTQSDASSNVL